jgi:hypothetical protein
MAAEITFDQPTGAGAGVAGKARNDLWLSQAVDMVSSGTGSTYLWELLDAPPGSSAVIANPTASTANITPDEVGTYRIQLTVDGGGLDNVIVKVIRARFSDSGELLFRGWALPAIDEEIDEADYGTNTRHWAEVWESIIPDVRGNLTRSLVFRPGGPAGGNVYASWSDLMVAFGETSGLVTVEIDGDYDQPVVPPGSWDFESRAILVGRGFAGFRVPLEIGDGSTSDTELSGVSGFRNLEVYAVNDATNTASNYIASDKIWFEDCDVYSQNIGAPRRMFEMEQSEIILRGRTRFLEGGTESIYVVPFNPGNSVYVENFSSIDESVLDVPANATVDIYLANQTTTYDTSQTVSGTLNAFSSTAYTFFVYRPGGISSGNVYSDWATLMGKVASTEGPKTIELDPSVDPNTRCDIPSGTWDLGYNTTLRGDGSVVVLMEDGANFRNASVLEGGLEIWSASTSVVFTWSGTKTLSLRDSCKLIGAQYPGQSAPTFPLLEGGSHVIDMRDDSALRASLGDQPVLDNDDLPNDLILMYDRASIEDGSGGSNQSYALNAGEQDDIGINFYSPASYFNHDRTNLNIQSWAVRQNVISLVKGSFSNASSTPSAVGGGHLDLARMGTAHSNLTARLLVLLETTSGTPGFEAYFDLYDVFGILNSGVPAVVAGSQVNTGTGVPPVGGPTTNPLVPSLYVVDLSSLLASVPAATASYVVLEARLWIGTTGGGNVATCKSAELAFEW